MKLEFNIRYHTEWGESVHILIHAINANHRVKTTDLEMVSEDGLNWHLESNIYERHQHPTIALWYSYQIEREGVGVTRRECNPVPRMVKVSNNKAYVFYDTWEDEPLHWDVDFNGPTVTVRLKSIPVAAPPFPTGHRTIILHVKAFGLLPDERIAVLGNIPTIGKWNVDRYVPMTLQGGDVWMLSINADMISSFPFQYKYVIVDYRTRRMKYWEAGENRRTGVFEDSDEDKVIVLNDTPVRIQRVKTYEAVPNTETNMRNNDGDVNGILR